MQAIAIVILALLMWAERASAQSPYSLTVGRHSTVNVSDSQVDTIFSEASKILQKDLGHVDTQDDVACNVTFARKGSIKTFALPSTPDIIHNAADRDAVHREDFDIKIVKKIEFCRTPGAGTADGCSWPPRARGGRISTIVIETPLDAHPNIGRLWAHELGHRMGLRHVNDSTALMTACPFDSEARVKMRECSCFLTGRRPSCTKPQASCRP